MQDRTKTQPSQLQWMLGIVQAVITNLSSRILLPASFIPKFIVYTFKVTGHS
jgi:hypothetical protein